MTHGIALAYLPLYFYEKLLRHNRHLSKIGYKRSKLCKPKSNTNTVYWFNKTFPLIYFSQHYNIVGPTPVIRFGDWHRHNSVGIGECFWKPFYHSVNVWHPHRSTHAHFTLFDCSLVSPWWCNMSHKTASNTFSVWENVTQPKKGVLGNNFTISPQEIPVMPLITTNKSTTWRSKTKQLRSNSLQVSNFS